MQIPNISKALLCTLVLFIPSLLYSQTSKVLTNHVGYEENKPKRAVLLADTQLSPESFQLINQTNGSVVYSGKPVFSGPVDKWKNWIFWTIDFSDYSTNGTYLLQVSLPGKSVISYPFKIGKNILEQATISDVIYYFKGQRASGLLDKADHHLALSGATERTIDAHGGWYDASGDYGKHLSHLSFSSYFNPQQISLTVWSLLKTYELLVQRTGTDFRQYTRRLLDEAMYGADYLTRMHPQKGSFYRSVSAPGPGKLPQDRVIRAEESNYRIKQNKDQSFTTSVAGRDWRTYQTSYRSGSGLSIAALAIAARYDTSGDYTNKDYLKAAEEAFAFLETDNVLMTNDGKENIVDDYTALCAATELYKTTKKDVYKKAAEKRAQQLINRLSRWKNYQDYWRADAKDRPFFHPSDAGLPIASLIYYSQIATPAVQTTIKQAIKRSLTFELAITREVTNPFGYSRQLVQDTAGNRRSTFFFPHGSEASPWWQGENARLGSIAAAARLAIPLFTEDKPFQNTLQQFAVDQLNWILGLNPYDACMLQGTGHNNPAYGFFGTFEYTNAPGGIVNGITSGLEDEHDIEFNLSYAKTGKDYDWRWAEQWLPHAAWYLLAVSIP
ncbi:glycoside hydrolase family 9 protein [Xanthocytophaga agilis]|uniref:Glycoside hydrolase family 9 protein n=1 Tax=Xanthocytophaga agilis TaxID=3048010 RepID=A0AAE3R437_9BACT|nr:glycoside hydrolase family 9 protein [Xanthocytophaga agilis]MDJ1501024.1 glycoside hydrolase family 9 protein [Xanthocytophaga agilis]